jgi:hypothetical protein
LSGRWRCSSLFVVVAWRFSRLMLLGGPCHEVDAAMLFEPDQWRAAIILHKKEPPATPLGLNEVIRLVATLGGFLALKGDGEHGVKTIRPGLQRVTDFAAGIRYVCEIAHE